MCWSVSEVCLLKLAEEVIVCMFVCLCVCVCVCVCARMCVCTCINHDDRWGAN